MNVTEMINTLSLRLEDAANIDFTDAMKLKALNNARIYVAQKLIKPYMTELQEIQTALVATNGEYALSSLTYDVLGGAQGIIAVKINGGIWCTDYDQTEIKKTENFYLAGTINNPLYRVFENKIHVSNGQTSPIIDVYYHKIPTKMIYKVDISALGTPATTGFIGDDDQNLSVIDDTYEGAVVYSINQDSHHIVTTYVGTTRTFTVTPAADANFGDDEIYFITNDFDELSIKPSSTNASMFVETCDLNKSVHELVVSLAEAECWAMDAQIDRKNAAEEMAKLMIETLNSRYIVERGIGTQGEFRKAISK